MTTTERFVPERFCWTRFGVESGETVDAILRRKEADRVAHNGLFLWGIGNSVGRALRELVRLEPSPKVLFSPMRSKPKAVDVAPSRLLTWSRAVTLNNDSWEVPSGLDVVSRAATGAGRTKTVHYALICYSPEPLTICTSADELQYNSMLNLMSLNKLGHSQVTAVVQHERKRGITGARYPISFVADLVYPYIVELRDPVPVSADDWYVRVTARIAHDASQPSLLPA